jgi:uncharacterized protein (DUF362 family)
METLTFTTLIGDGDTPACRPPAGASLRSTRVAGMVNRACVFRARAGSHVTRGPIVVYPDMKMDRKRHIHRRDFVKMTAAAGGAALASTALSACSRALRSISELEKVYATVPPLETDLPGATPTAIPTARPTPTPNPLGRVALVRTDDRVDGIGRALDLLETNPVRGKATFLKPNFNSADPFPGSTHPGTLLALAERLEAMGAERLTIGDRSGMGDTRAVMRANGTLELAAERGWSTLVFDDLGADQWVRFPADGSHWRNGYALPRPVLEADGVVQTCCLKTHRFGGHFTLSLKNSVGLVAKRVPGEAHDYMTELHGTAHQRRMIAEINSAYKPDLVVLDGMEAFVDGGPDRGTKVVPGVILASADRVALDAVGVAILRLYATTPEVGRGPIFAQEQIQRAAELGLGAAGPDQIDIVVADDRSRQLAAQLTDLLFAD